MSKKRAIMKKIGGLLAAVLVTVTILPVGLVNARAERWGSVSVDGGGTMEDFCFSLVNSEESITISSVSASYHHRDRNDSDIICVVIHFTTQHELGDEVTGRISCRYDGRSIEMETSHDYFSKRSTEAPYDYQCGGSLYLRHRGKEVNTKKEEKSSSSSSSMSEEEKQREAARHFAPDESTMTSEQKAGWSVVSRDPVVPSPGTGAGTSIKNAYQGPMCRMAFQMTAPAGYALGHTYDMELATGAGGNAGLKVPQDLMKTGRKYVVAFVVPGGPSVATAPLTPDAGGNINFNTTLLGLPAGSNYAMAIMYADV